MNVVIVESPAKAKTINKYLGKGYTVLASYGHIRDLPSKDGSVDPDAGFAMKWEVDAKAKKHIADIAKAVKGADHLYLATDPDREGEAIAWHVREVLKDKNLLKGVDVKRVVFNEITKNAILDAFENPRELNQELVEAYLARRALDYLVGFTLSPVLWRKLPGSRSAGRVQSVALRLICDRETEIEDFTAQEYWTIKAALKTEKGAAFEALLSHLGGTKIAKMGIETETQAKDAAAVIESGNFTVSTIEKRQANRHPTPPFTTSTLQQEAARKLHFSTKRTMGVAQKLYEGVSLGGETVGLITYMRTDGVHMAREAINSCRALIGRDYGEAYLPKAPRAYKAKAKNAQEAHEAIRPTDLYRRPKDIAAFLDGDQKKLYDLIWKRAVASQMASARLDQVAVDLEPKDKAATLHATGSVIAFDGFYKLYREDRDDRNGSAGGQDRLLPDLKEGEPVELEKVEPEQHFTQPPPRFTEASLVKRLEELGIGRPSTYASIISVLQDRDYVILDKRRFTPEDRGRLVTAFLSSFFPRYVEYDFTAEMEEKLDDVSGGRFDWKALLEDFWAAFSKAVDETKDLRVREVLDTLDDLLGPHFFRDDGSGTDPRDCPSCKKENREGGRLSLKLGKFGAFIGCSNYPECKLTKPLAVTNGNAEEPADAGPVDLGKDPATDKAVTLRKGPYGYYVQLGEGEGEGKKKTKPKRASLARGQNPAEIDLKKALGLLALPRDIGPDPETGEIISAGLGRFGPYIKMGATYVSLKGDDDVLSIGINRAVDLMASAPKKEPPKIIGPHPKGGKDVTLRKGRWGSYVQHGAVRANLPKGTDAEALTLEQAVALLAAKKGGNKKAAKKKPAVKKKPAAKKAG